MKIKEIVPQIIALKSKYHLREKDATPKKEREWYTWALANGHVEFVEKNGILLGFLEWVRLNYIPKNADDIHLDYNILKTGPIAFAGNVIASEPGIFRILLRSAADKNKDAFFFCWHNKIHNKIRIFQRREL